MPSDTVWRDHLLGYFDDHAGDIVADLVDLIQIPTVSGSAEKNEIQHPLGSRLAEQGLEVDNWEIALPDTLAADDFPGVEVDRSEGWWTVGRLAGSGGSPSLMLNAHVDVVLAGDLRTWGELGPSSRQFSL